MPPLTYSRKLACYFVSERRKWLLVKNRAGHITKLEQRELEGCEVKLKDISMEVKAAADEALDEFDSDEEI